MADVAHDPTLATLRAQWQTKNDEAQAVIDNPSSTGEAYRRAEKALVERDAIGERIKDRQSDLARIDEIRHKYDAGAAFAGMPSGARIPFSVGDATGARRSYGSDGASADSRFRVTGYEPAGSTSFLFDQQSKMLQMVEEAGAGTLGQKRWELLNSMEYRIDFNKYLRFGTKQIDLHTKTLMEGMDDQGGVFAPAELIARVIGRLPAPTHLRSLVTTLTTGRETLLLPRKQYGADDIYTTAFRVTWTGEIPSDGTGAMTQVNDANLLGNIEIPVHTAMLSAPVTRNLIEDSAFPIQAWLESELAQVVDLEYENQIINGGSIGTPTGILFGAASSNAETNTYPEVILSNTAGGIDYNSLISTQMALAPQYETDNLRWVMNKRSTYAALNLIKDSQNRPLFTTGYGDSGLVGRRQRILLGDEITLSQFMPAVGASNFPIIYGDLRGYYVAQRVGFSIQVLDQTRAKANQIELVGRIRFGGRPVEPFRLKLLKSNNS